MAKVNATQGAISDIETMVMEGIYRPGERLPVEAELADRLGVSRNTLREAVRALSFVGVLEVRQGDGTFVAEMDPDQLFTGLRLFAQTATDDRLAAVLEARRVLEPQLTALAAARRTADDLVAIEEALDAMYGAPNVVAMVEADHEFHRRVCRAAQSVVLEHVLDNISLTTLRLRVWYGQENEQHRKSSLAEHSGLFESIRRGDAAVAEASALLHVERVQRWLSQHGAAAVADVRENGRVTFDREPRSQLVGSITADFQHDDRRLSKEHYR